MVHVYCMVDRGESGMINYEKFLIVFAVWFILIILLGVIGAIPLMIPVFAIGLVFFVVAGLFGLADWMTN